MWLSRSHFARRRTTSKRPTEKNATTFWVTPTMRIKLECDIVRKGNAALVESQERFSLKHRIYTHRICANIRTKIIYNAHFDTHLKFWKWCHHDFWTDFWENVCNWCKSNVTSYVLISDKYMNIKISINTMQFFQL